MDSQVARNLFKIAGPATAFVAVEHPDGAQDIGTAFHVGEGVFVTARHVVEDVIIRRVGITERFYLELDGEEAKNATTRLNGTTPVQAVGPQSLRISRGPFGLEDERIDVAVFQVESIDPATPAPPLGGHLDDWASGQEFILDEAIIAGYPSIPMSKGDVRIVAARAEINTAVDRWDTHYAHFILSTMPRGGFSGGMVLGEGGYVMGVITSALHAVGKEWESGFMTAVAVEPIYHCLAAHRMLPREQGEMWDGLFDDIADDPAYANPMPLATVQQIPAEDDPLAPEYWAAKVGEH